MPAYYKHTLHRKINIFEQEDPRFQKDLKLNPELEVDIDAAVHKADSHKIIINYPGAGGHVDGYNNKYLTLANCMQNSIGTVVRMANKRIPGIDYAQLLRENLKSVIEYAVNNANEICGSHKPSIYLMGFSDGAGAIAAVAHLYPKVEKVLLFAPSFGAGREEISRGLKEYKNDLYVVIGNDDCVVAVKNGQIFKDLAESSKLSRLEVIPNCDHQFRGKINGKILSKAPFWAFCGDSTFPSPDGGLNSTNSVLKVYLVLC